MGSSSDARRRVDALGSALRKMKSSTSEACRCCDQLTKRARHLDSLTSPASDASSMLSKAANNLGAALVLMKDAREKFDTVRDCEPAIERLHRGITDIQAEKGGTRNAARHNPFDDDKSKVGKARNNPFDDDKNKSGKVVLSEQDIYAAADSMEIIRDAYEYFIERKHWRSTANALASLERVHLIGVNSMCALASFHLLDAGQAVRIKRVVKQEGETVVTPGNETAQQTRERLSAALQNRDLLRSIGEFEEYQPVEARKVRELRGIFECLGGNGYHLNPPPKEEPPGLSLVFGIPANKVVRTEKVGSGSYTSLTQNPLKTGFPHVDAYGESRKATAFGSIENYYRRVKQERKRAAERFNDKLVDAVDSAARDAVRCLEHAMVVVAGEKNVYRTVVSPSLTKIADEDAVNDEISPFYRKACAAAYSYVVACVVDRTMDIIETVFLKEGGIGHTSGSKNDATSPLTVATAASAAAAGLRMLDGVRMLGPSLAKLCDIPIGDGSENLPSIASTLCIAIHRTTVKNTARTLENLAKAIQEDPLKGSAQRPKDARVAPLTVDVVRSVKLVSPFVSAYKSVSKRRALPWDPNMGEEAGELESFVRFLIVRLLNSLKGKAQNYTKHPGDLGQARSSMFMMNNTFYLRDELGPVTMDFGEEDAEFFRIEGSWFVDKVNKMFESEKSKYLAHWEVLNTHLTNVEKDELEYKQNDTILSLESGRLIKNRFSGFNEDFENIFEDHKELAVVDPRLRDVLQKDVADVFLPVYRSFFDKYSKIRFSKKHQDEYTKYPPYKIEEMLSQLYTDAE